MRHHRDFSLAAPRLGRNDTIEERFPVRHFVEPVRAMPVLSDVERSQSPRE
ncbi:MAG: hypothetical protein WBB65_14165 [Anaerolineales bacterium]